MGAALQEGPWGLPSVRAPGAVGKQAGGVGFTSNLLCLRFTDDLESPLAQDTQWLLLQGEFRARRPHSSRL